jgi:hypothetical protein
MTVGTAHITFRGGALTLPASTAYDRQLLIDHTLAFARDRQQLRVRVDSATWSVERPDAQHPVVCRRCERRINHAVCRRPRGRTAAYCVACVLRRPRLTMAALAQLPAAAVLRDVQAHYAYGEDWVAWTRWTAATPTEIMEDMRLQRRFAPVLIWTCAEVPHGLTASAER